MSHRVSGTHFQSFHSKRFSVNISGEVKLPAELVFYSYVVYTTYIKRKILYININTYILHIIYYKWSKVIHDTQSAQISQKQDGHNIYVIMKTMCPPSYQHNGFVAIHALGHMMYHLNPQPYIMCPSA